jgi:hypothetical protein
MGPGDAEQVRAAINLIKWIKLRIIEGTGKQGFLLKKVLKNSKLEAIGVWRGVSKGVEDGLRLPACRWATPETAVKPFQEWHACRL